MNEITRIHIAKTAYDIELAAKKQLEKYLKSLETYTQDADVLADIEIRITELLSERGVQAGGVVSSDDIAAIRSQLGEPHEFADDNDIAVGPSNEASSRRLYRSTDDSVLGGVLSGIAAYFNVNPLWTRLVFVLLLFVSFGFVVFAYVLLWIIVPPARTATEKLQLAGKEVTLESIKELNADEEKAYPNRVAPLLQRILLVSLGSLSALSALGTFVGTAWLVIAALTVNTTFADMTNQFTGLGEGYVWLVQLLFWITIAGLLLLTALFGLVAYAFFAKKVTKTMLISGAVIIVLGVVAAATVIGVGATQSLRVANESRGMTRETKVTLPKDFANVTSVTFERKAQKAENDQPVYISGYATLRYIVDEGPARYELSGLPTAKVVAAVEGTHAVVSLDVPDSFRNAFVQPVLTVYGPALQSMNVSDLTNVAYEGQKQPMLTISAAEESSANVTGEYGEVKVTGSGSVDLGSSAVGSLAIQSKLGLRVVAGTVRDLKIDQPDVCPNGTSGTSTTVQVSGVTSGTMTYNGSNIPAKSHTSGCASVVVESRDLDGYENDI